MKHIAIIPNYSGITDMVKSGEIAPNFLVKSENDQKVHFSNAAGYQILTSDGDVYNMYINNQNQLEADITFSGGFSFQLLKDGDQVTADISIGAIAYCEADIDYSESHTGVTNFEFSWPYGDTSWQINYFPEYNLVQADGRYTLTEQECCEYRGGTWDPETCECGQEDPCAEYESQEECECAQQGGTWEGSECVMPSDDPCDGDPECECNNTDGYHFWEDNTCHDCVEEWEELGYSSPEDCACDKRGEDSGVCPEPDPCAGMEQDISDCEGRGGTWDYANCFCIEPEDQPCGGDPECECEQQGGTWSGSECQMPSDE